MGQTIMLVLYITFFVMLRICSSLDSITVIQNITDGETIVSGNERFELGFFSPGSSKNRYLGTWFKNTSPHTIVWVANRETPLINTSGMVKLDSQGVLSLVNGGDTIIWSSNSSVSSPHVNHPRAQLLDTGNLVIKDENNVIWQSFDYPGDTLLSGMKLGKNLLTEREIYLTSWRSADDPSLGEYTFGFVMLRGKYPQVYIRKNTVIESRMGPYNGIEFAGQPSYEPNPVYLYRADMDINQKEMYFKYTFNSTTFASRVIATPAGKLEIWILNMRNHQWMQDLSLPLDNCDYYGLCGTYGSCSLSAYPKCGCLKGFEPKNPEELSPYNQTSGCRRSTPLDCGPGEGFLKYSSMKLPDTQNATFHGSMSLQKCEVACKNNCSCTAYANPNITAGAVGCLLWFGDWTDIRVYSQNGQDLYVRLAASDLLVHSGIQRKKQVFIKVTLSISAGLTLLGLILTVYIWSKRKRRSDAEREEKIRASHHHIVSGCLQWFDELVDIPEYDAKLDVYIKMAALESAGNWYALDKKNNSVHMEDFDELPFYSQNEILKATDNFSINNKIGEGGFGPVYKGVLEDGQEIAVKRLSETSQQGLDEFKNEIICIAKLQHRNLVKLLGYCIHGKDMILIYEYMNNKSLDSFLFDETRSSMLDWPQRFNIIRGIARGILYLHQDSRLQIIHRDLKASNILLDADMNPKISDFGLARKFVGLDTTAKTKKVVGTYGYISPEYAVHGRFSIKSDVFSFGVLLLEIVSGKRNKEFSHEDHGGNLLGHAWRLHTKGRSVELASASLCDSCIISEVVRSIHIALLCVQHHAKDRPTMLSVVLMLASEGVLPQPKQPAFFIEESSIEHEHVSSADDYMITLLYAR